MTHNWKIKSKNFFCLQSKNFPPDKRHPGHRSRYGKYGPRSGYGFFTDRLWPCQPIRIENFEKPYNNTSYHAQPHSIIAILTFIILIYFTLFSWQPVIGPNSVGYELITKSLVYGGSTSTATDFAVAAGLCSIGDSSRVAHLDSSFVSSVVLTIRQLLEDSIDQVKVWFTLYVSQVGLKISFTGPSDRMSDAWLWVRHMYMMMSDDLQFSLTRK
jgi:hypothetical protein